MTKFTNGPAHGITLMLRRAPYFLRVTHNGKAYDALDQLTDKAEPHETIHLYRVTSVPGWCHIRAAKGEGGMYAMGDYEYVASQPSDAILRDNEKFADWCANQTDDHKRWEAMQSDARKS